MGTLNAESWTDFWDSGSITTFSSFTNNYDGEIAEFWRQQLRDTKGHVLDLCCGNGALVWLVDDLVKTHHLDIQITGVDLADIDPFKLLKRSPKDFPAVNFIGNTSIETLPFKDKSISAVISQYGIEYSDTGKTLKEVGRVLSDNGKIAFIVHIDKSVVVQDSRFRLDKFIALTEGGEFEQTLFLLDDLFNQYHRFQQVRSDPQFVRLTGTLNRLAYHATHLHEDKGPVYEKNCLTFQNYVTRILKLFDESLPVRDRKRRGKIEQLVKIFPGMMSRMEDIISAA
ncbi:MAG TPA: class I SAM-dependent methyltransferase, partial [Spongiibacteraceae bacterium]|nr:class I SAM-dependent methyltransferase [Spongiibacteraceae bacterium]